jgi:Resolvase, N terminal domain
VPFDLRGARQRQTTVRPELDACLKSLRKGDTLVVWRLDQLGRGLSYASHNRTPYMVDLREVSFADQSLVTWQTIPKFASRPKAIPVANLFLVTVVGLPTDNRRVQATYLDGVADTGVLSYQGIGLAFAVF